MSTDQNVFEALRIAGDEVDLLVADLDADGWNRSTPAPGWTVAHQVAHLVAVFQLAGLAASAPERFRALTASLTPDFDANVTAAMAPHLALPRPDLLDRWRGTRRTTVEALAAAPGDQLLPWLVNPLPPAVLASAGLMELFGHGQDIADALGVRREPSDRLRHLVAFAVRVRDFGYAAHGLTPPAEEFRFELTAPSGAEWTFGPPEATQRISGPANDFCLLVTRRRHHADLSVEASGELAQQWLELAQAYRGPAGPGRRPGQFAPVGTAS